MAHVTNQKTAAHVLRLQAAGLVRLTRWDEHILFTTAATLLGVNMAVYHHAADSLDARLILVTAANVLAVTFAFMVNDIEDAADDARDRTRGARNAITRHMIAPRTGRVSAGFTAALALVLFALVNPRVWMLGALTVALGFLYSWRGVRLKALPVVDVLSHVLMLSALLFLAGYVAYDPAAGRVWLVAVGVAFISAYGQFYNQLRDYEQDRAAGLCNTASLFGKRRTRWMMYAALGTAALCLAITAVVGLWPPWLLLVLVGLAPLLRLFRPDTDLRGTVAIDASGRLQLGAMAIAVLALLIWLVVQIAH